MIGNFNFKIVCTISEKRGKIHLKRTRTRPCADRLDDACSRGALTFFVLVEWQILRDSQSKNKRLFKNFGELLEKGKIKKGIDSFKKLKYLRI